MMGSLYALSEILCVYNDYAQAVPRIMQGLFIAKFVILHYERLKGAGRRRLPRVKI